MKETSGDALIAIQGESKHVGTVWGANSDSLPKIQSYITTSTAAGKHSEVQGWKV